ncbi:hypothetical protein [Streptomyces sp. NPDC001930]|uniref:hypothetical protein n=1 Tax=Streptomyces sp. NPDC001930 TaxID=3364625 RepID=UPI0036B31AC6
MLTSATCIAISVTTVSYALPVTSRSADSPAPRIGGEVESSAESSVDDGEIRYREATKYDAIRKHAHKVSQAGPLSNVKLQDDTATTVNDLEWIARTGTTRPTLWGQPFTRYWSSLVPRPA